MKTQFWRTITPVKGEPIPEGAMWRTNGQSVHWHFPPSENWTAFTNNMLEWEWRVPVEVVPLDVAVELFCLLCNNSVQVVFDLCSSESCLTMERLRELVTAKLREMSKEEPCN